MEGQICTRNRERPFGLIKLRAEVIVAHLYCHVGIVNLRVAFDVNGMACRVRTMFVLLIIKGRLVDCRFRDGRVLLSLVRACDGGSRCTIQ